MATDSHPTKTASARPLLVVVAIVTLWFLGITAVAGGLDFFIDLGMQDPKWIEEIPLVVNSAVPGLTLGIGFGIGSLVTALGVTLRLDWPWLNWLERLTRHHWAWFGTLALGIGMMTWIGLQLIWISLSFLHVIYGAVGIGLFGISLTGSYRAYLGLTDQIA